MITTIALFPGDMSGLSPATCRWGKLSPARHVAREKSYCCSDWIRAKEAIGWIPEFSEDEEDDDHSEQEFISSEQSDLGLHIDGEDNGASEVPKIIFKNSDG
ncbi:hypothetical protein Tco_0181518, partial [Tanacetum coccineum]